MAGGTITADGTIFELSNQWNGGNWDAELHLSGNFGGGTVTIYKWGQTGWLALTGGVYTAADDDIVHASGQRRYTAILTGSTAPSLVWDFV